nr:uncharacterized protein LOC109179053 [Ipomoea batatas]
MGHCKRPSKLATTICSSSNLLKYIFHQSNIGSVAGTASDSEEVFPKPMGKKASKRKAKERYSNNDDHDDIHVSVSSDDSGLQKWTGNEILHLGARKKLDRMFTHDFPTPGEKVYYGVIKFSRRLLHVQVSSTVVVHYVGHCTRSSPPAVECHVFPVAAMSRNPPSESRRRPVEVPQPDRAGFDLLCSLFICFELKSARAKLFEFGKSNSLENFYNTSVGVGIVVVGWYCAGVILLLCKVVSYNLELSNIPQQSNSLENFSNTTVRVAGWDLLCSKLDVNCAAGFGLLCSWCPELGVIGGVGGCAISLGGQSIDVTCNII